jgi:hypothetical protein
MHYYYMFFLLFVLTYMFRSSFDHQQGATLPLYDTLTYTGHFNVTFNVFNIKYDNFRSG